MALPNIKVNLSEKIISTDGRSLRLEDNFEGAGIFKIGDSDDELALELSYRKNKEFCEDDEANKVYDFFQTSSNDDLKKLDVCSTREEDFKCEVFPAVAITGKFSYNISG